MPPARWQISTASTSRMDVPASRAACPIIRAKTANPMGKRARIIRSVAVDSIVAGQRSFRCWSNPRAIPSRKAAPIPCQKVGSLTQAVKPSIQSWAVALAIASRSTGVRSSRNCCRSSVALRVIRSVAVDSIVADRGVTARWCSLPRSDHCSGPGRTHTPQRGSSRGPRRGPCRWSHSPRERRGRSRRSGSS